MLAELRLGQVLFEIVENPGPGETVQLRAAVDARFDATLVAGPAGLSFALSPPSAADTTVAVLTNPLAVDEAAVDALLPSMLAGLLPDISAGLGTIPLPGVVGASVELSRSPYYTAYAGFGSLL
jgi:hypothetical protein